MVVNLTVYDNIKQMLINHGITKEYTQAELDNYILEAKVLVDTPFMNDNVMEDYIKEWAGDVYCTKEYPLRNNTIELTINNTVITPVHVTYDGIIYLDKTYHGDLKCRYTVGLNNDDINSYVVPIVVCLIENIEGSNIASVNEGDVSISYDNSTSTTRTLDNLVNNLRNKYGARVRLI